MPNIVLSTEYQTLGYFTCQEGSNYRLNVKAKYSVTVGGTADIHVAISFSGANVSGTGKSVINSGTAQNFSFSRNVDSEISEYRITYGADGTSTNNSLTVALSNMSATWSDGTPFNATPTRSSLSFVFDLPPIDNRISLRLNSITAIDPYNIYSVAGHTKLNINLSLEYARVAYIEITGAGVTTTYQLSPTYVQTETITQIVNIPSSSNGYNLTVRLFASNNRESMHRIESIVVAGYSLPTIANNTYTARCDSSGNPDPNGTYGRLYLTWDVTAIDTQDPNTLQVVTTKVNDNTLTATSGSIQLGYLDYLFALAENVQGNLEIYLEDEVSNNTITSLVIPKSTMPLSLYQNGDSVGIAVGRMATDRGFWCYEQFYLKSSTLNSTKVFNIQVDDNGNITASEVL